MFVTIVTLRSCSIKRYSIFYKYFLLEIGDQVTRFVQKSKDLTDIIISFKAIDLESGVRKVDFILQSADESVTATDTVPIHMMTPVSYILFTLLLI